MRSMKQHMAFLLAAVITFGSSGIQTAEAAKTSSASDYTVTVGAQLHLGAKNATTYKVSDQTIASVNKDGVVTGKKPGQVTVTAKNSSKKLASYSVTVNSASKLPNLPVTFSEIAMVDRKLEEQDTGGYLYTAKIKNTSPATVKKVIYTYQIQTVKYQKVAEPVQGDVSASSSYGSGLNDGSVGTGTNITTAGTGLAATNNTSPAGTGLAVTDMSPVGTGSAVNNTDPSEKGSAITDTSPVGTGSVVTDTNPVGTGSAVTNEGSVGMNNPVGTNGDSAKENSASVTTGSAAEVTYKYVPDKSTVKTTTVTFTAKNIKAGKKSKAVTIQGDYTGDIDKMKLVKIELYSGKAEYVYKASDKNVTLKWGVPDTQAPTFHGYTKGQSTCRDIPYLTVYTDRRGSADYTQFVSATDDRKGAIDIDSDTSAVNWKKTGTYKVKLIATDKAGNKAKTWVWVSVVVPGTAESIADQVLASITSGSWSKERKARAIYSYVRGRMSYIQHAGHPDYRTAGVSGIRNCSGDCYTYYAVSRLLLTRVGIPNLMVTRYPVTSRHFWNLVYVNGGWYHFDTTPRSRGGTFCLLTDAQMHALYPGATFSFQTSLYPARATKRIS